jgi:hypothetical protein
LQGLRLPVVTDVTGVPAAALRFTFTCWHSVVHARPKGMGCSGVEGQHHGNRGFLILPISELQALTNKLFVVCLN